MLLLSSADYFQNQLFLNIIRVSKGLAPDQHQHSVRPDLGPNCLQRLSADDTSKQRVKALVSLLIIMSH